MAKYIKKPVVIKAIQWTGSNIAELKAFVGEDLDPNKSEYIVANKAPSTGTHYGYSYNPIIHTLEGDMTVSLMDYVIKGIHGEHYPCKKDIFEETYEKVEE